jgi:stage V sporulation protein B
LRLIADPNFHVIGAVISTTACYMMAMLVNLSALKWHTRITFEWKDIFVKPFAASLVMGMASYAAYAAFMELTASNAASAVSAIAIGVMVYFVILILLGGLRRADALRIPFLRKKI